MRTARLAELDSIDLVHCSVNTDARRQEDIGAGFLRNVFVAFDLLRPYFHRVELSRKILDAVLRDNETPACEMTAHMLLSSVFQRRDDHRKSSGTVTRRHIEGHGDVAERHLLTI